MKIPRRKYTVNGIFFVAIALFMGLGAFVFSNLSQEAHAAVDKGRLITVYDRGVEQVFLSESESVEEALVDAGFELDARDAVEPAREEPLVATDYKINIYRARPVTVVDGAMRQKVMTPYQTPERIAADAGVELYPEDIVDLGQSDDFLNDGAGLQLTVDRATVFVFDLYGKETEVRTQANTVGGMLEEKGISLGDSDMVSPSVSTKVTADMKVRVWREGVQTVTVEEDVEFEVEYIQDADREIGYKEVKTLGVKGERTVTYEIKIENGKEVSRKEIASITTKPAVKQVEVIGAKLTLGKGYSEERKRIMTEAGIPEDQQPYAAFIIDHENANWCPTRWQGTNGCPTTYYEKFEGAMSSSLVGYGMCQSTPGIKMASAGADWKTNPVTQMKWCTSYANSRYGSWKNAYDKWRARAIEKTGNPNWGGWW